MPDSFQTIRVRLSSEVAESIALTPVVSQEMPLSELIANIVSVTGKDPVLIAETLQRGTLVSGMSRFRWQGLTVPPELIEPVLNGFPDAEPERPYVASRCSLLILRSVLQPLMLEKTSMPTIGLWRRKSLWDCLLALFPDPVYREYSYREKADVYRAGVLAEQQACLLDLSQRFRHASLTRTLTSTVIEAVDLYVSR